MRNKMRLFVPRVDRSAGMPVFGLEPPSSKLLEFFAVGEAKARSGMDFAGPLTERERKNRVSVVSLGATPRAAQNSNPCGAGPGRFGLPVQSRLAATGRAGAYTCRRSPWSGPTYRAGA